MGPSNPLLQVDFKVWDEASESLFSSLEDYSKLCSNLAPNSLGEDLKPNDRAARVESTLTALAGQLLKTYATLARARNRLVSPLLRLPRELISKILAHTVFSYRISSKYEPTSMEQQLWAIQYCLNGLLRVCSEWRSIITTEGRFWSIIPMIRNHSINGWQPLKDSLQNSTGCALYLAVDDAIWYYPSNEIPEVLTKFRPRFYAINFNLKDFQVIKGAMDTLLQSDPPESLTELSMRLNQRRDVTPMLPEDSDYIVHRNQPQWTKFTDILGALTSFRISGIHIHWDRVAFSTRLVELLVHNVTLGYDEAIVPFLHSLSSASGLRDLKIISVATLHRPDVARNTDAPLPVSFPNLRSLLLQDIYLNTLECLLHLIGPGSHSTVLFLTKRCLEVNVLGDAELGGGRSQASKLDELCALLKPIPVDTLMLSESGDSRHIFSQGSTLRTLLKALPSLKTLKLDNWACQRFHPWREIKQPPEARTDPHCFPALENLYFFSADICYTPWGLIEEALASHPLRRIVFGGSFARMSSTHTSRNPIRESDDLVERFGDMTPDFGFVGCEYQPAEFHSAKWMLW